MRLNSLLLVLSFLSVSFIPFNLSTQFSFKLLAESEPNNLNELPDDPEQLMIWTCREGTNRILLEAKNDNIWQSIIDQQSWNCQQGLSDTSTGDLKFSCEPSSDEMLGLLTITWIEGESSQEQMGQWMHTLVKEHNMICRIAKVELWDSNP